VTWDKMLVDAMTMRMVIKPQSIDTVVATNLHADILSDLAAALAGSLGIAPTANLNPERTFPSMFEPIHGSAFDIMGKGIANPVGTFWSAVMMLDHLGEPAAGARLMRRSSASPPTSAITRPISAARRAPPTSPPP
jgi:tartrate dehydrogenase/decarboxylase/D-malate dehydrogenase